MILYLQDWASYPTARPQLDTTNESFIHIARLYRDMGVKNHMFPLALVNPLLRGINPHDPDLEPQYWAMVAGECKINPWYYFREVARAPGISGGAARMVEANRGNIALWWSYFNHITTFLIQIRQTGKSFSVDTLDVGLMNIICTNTHINLLTKDDGLRKKNIDRIREIEEELPFYLRRRTKDDISNQEELSYNLLGNGYKGHLPQKQAKMANNAARGFTSANFRIDEGPFQPNIDIALPAALPAGNKAREEARKAGSPYGTILTTTAGKRNEKEGAYFYAMISNAAPWSEAFLDAENESALEQMVRANSRKGELRINITMNHRQLGKSDEWLARELEDSMAKDGDPENMKRDFFNVWTSGTTSNPLSPQTLLTINNSLMEPKYNDVSDIGGYMLKWFIPEQEIRRRMTETKYLLLVDTSDAGGGDDISVRIMDIRNGDTLATGTYNLTNIITWSEWLADLMLRYENLILVPENRSSATAVIDNITLILPSKGMDPFKRVYNKIVQERDEHPQIFEEISMPMSRRPHHIYTRYKKTFGFATSGTGAYSRGALFGGLQTAARNMGHLVKDKETIDQISSLVTINDRVDHPPGGHDDMVIGWLLGQWFLSRGRNLSHYGINHTDLLKEVRKQVIHTPAQSWNNKEQRYIQERIKELTDKLATETNQFLIDKFEDEMRALAPRVVTTDSEKFSLEELLQHTREERKKRRSRYDGHQNQNNVYNREQQVKRRETVYRDPTMGYFSDYF